MTALREIAEKYRNAGWNIVPLYNFSKIPDNILTKNEDGTWQPSWKPLEERMATEEEFNKWFGGDLLTGLGVITGKISGIVVIDEDSYKADGMEFGLISPMVSQTGRGGKHHFFKYTEPIKTSGFRKGVNIEIKATGGFVVLPPSQVLKDSNSADLGTYTWLKKCKISELPPITEESLSKYRGNANGKAVDILELRKSAAGSRHNNLRTLALAIFNRFAPKEWELAEDIILKEAAEFDPPPPLTEVSQIIKDCKVYIKTHPKEVIERELQVLEPRTLNSLLAERLAEKELEARAPKTGWPELDDIIKGFIPTHLYTVTGSENVGKSSLAANFAARLSKQGFKTLYIALEPGIKILDYLASACFNKRFDEITSEDYENLDDGNIRVFVDRDIEHVQQLVATVRNLKEHYDLIIIDHIGYFVKSKENFIQEQSNVVKELAFLAKEKKTAIMMIAHLRKKSSAMQVEYIPTNDDISGSGAFKQDSTEVMIVIRKKDPNDEYQVKYVEEGMLFVTKTKCGPNGVVPLTFSERKAYISSRMERNQMTEQVALPTERPW